jgi:hypothetical protein
LCFYFVSIRVVVRSYCDYAHVTENDQEFAEMSLNCSTTVNSPSRSDGKIPVRLHYLVSERERDGLDDIVSWQPHDRCFVAK